MANNLAASENGNNEKISPVTYTSIADAQSINCEDEEVRKVYSKSHSPRIQLEGIHANRSRDIFFSEADERLLEIRQELFDFDIVEHPHDVIFDSLATNVKQKLPTVWSELDCSTLTSTPKEIVEFLYQQVVADTVAMPLVQLIIVIM